MKKFAAVLILSLSAVLAFATSAAEARTISFACEGTGHPTLNRFSGSGSVDTNGSKAEGHFAGSVTFGGQSQAVDVGSLDTKGTVRVFPAGTYTANELTVLQLSAPTSREEKPYTMIFNLGLENSTGSTFTVNGIPYKAHCYAR